MTVGGDMFTRLDAAAMASVVGNQVAPANSLAVTVETSGLGPQARVLAVSVYRVHGGQHTLTMATVDWSGHELWTPEVQLRADDTAAKLGGVGYPFNAEFMAAHAKPHARVASWLSEVLTGALETRGDIVLLQGLSFTLPQLVTSQLISGELADRIADRFLDPCLLHKASRLSAHRFPDDTNATYYDRVGRMSGESAAIKQVYPAYDLPAFDDFWNPATAPCCFKAAALWSIYWQQCDMSLRALSGVATGGSAELPGSGLPDAVLAYAQRPADEVYSAVSL